MSFTAGKRASEMPVRNESLAKDYLATFVDGSYKYSSVDLIIKYKVSHGRMYQLLKKAGVKRK